MARILLTTLFPYIWSLGAIAQLAPPAANEVNLLSNIPYLKIVRTEAPIIIDGELTESAWFEGIAAKNFWQYFPSDSASAEMQTEVYMTYDEENLYVAVKCYSVGEDYIVPSLRRDFRAGGNDNISLMFDTFNDKTNAFLFGINPLGVRREALISGGGQEINGFSTSWDNKWQAEAKIYKGYWVGEFAIPFKTLRFKEGSTKWRFNCYRFDTQNNERTTWMRIPRNQWIFNLAYMGDIIWEDPLKKPSGANISVIPYYSANMEHENRNKILSIKKHIPYYSANMEQDFEATDTKANFDFDNVGGDAKIAITSGLNLDLTINPDFSQVEVDRQVIDLQRFEIFFPERRQFFLENADLFGGFGMSRINPFFSRRIGIGQDTINDKNIPNPILYGARLSGKISENMRVGLLNMQTTKDQTNGQPSFNYTVATLQQKIFARSNIGLIAVNKQAFGARDSSLFSPYNRVMGFDYNLASSDNTWTGKTFYHHAFTSSNSQGKGAHGVELTYTKRKFQVEWLHQWVNEGYDAEVGFVPRQDFFRINPLTRFFFYPSKGAFNQYSFGTELEMIFTPEADGRSDHEIELFWDFDLRNNARGRFSLVNQYTWLNDAFDPTGVSDTTLSAFTQYNYTNFTIEYNSDRRKQFSFRLEPTIGQFYNGFRAGLNGNLNFRYQPFGQVSINYSYNYLRLEEPFKPISLFLIGPRIDFTFSKKFFLTTFIQYNSQADNLNINARLQWRFKPVSDFFLVFTDNYLTDPLSVKNRAIVAKVTYWLNL